MPSHFVTTLAPLASTALLDTMVADDSNVMEMTSAEQRAPKALDNDVSFVRFNDIDEESFAVPSTTPRPIQAFTSTSATNIEAFRSVVASTTPTSVVFPTSTLSALPSPSPQSFPSSTFSPARPSTFLASTTPRPFVNQNFQVISTVSPSSGPLVATGSPRPTLPPFTIRNV